MNQNEDTKELELLPRSTLDLPEMPASTITKGENMHPGYNQEMIGIKCELNHTYTLFIQD